MFWQRVDVPFGDYGSSLLQVLGVRPEASARNISVAIVGGGLAGLVAAFEASSLGFKVNILEGRAHRNGGRIQTKSDFLRGMWAEAGPEFISSAHSFLQWYISKFGLNLIETEGMIDSPFTPVLYDKRIDTSEIFKASQNLKSMLVEAAETLDLDDFSVLEDLDHHSLWKFVEGRLKDEFSTTLLKYFETHFEFENGINPRKIGLLPYLLLVKSHGIGFFENLEKYRLAGGMSLLINSLEHNLGRPILRKFPIKKISKGRKFLLLEDASGGREAKKIGNMDAVILTVPPRLWMSGALFDTTIKSELIPQMGDSIKILIKVPNNVSFSAGILPSVFLEKDKLVQAIWESGIGSHDTHKILTIMCGAGSAEELGKLSMQDAINLVVREIAVYYPEISSISDKANFYFKDWGRKKLTGCGYGCPAPYELTDFRQEFSEVIPDQLYLCGEWDSWEMWGYMEGAVRSALTAVLKLSAHHNLNIPECLREKMVL